MKPIHTYMQGPDGTRKREVVWSEGVSILVSSRGSGNDEEVEAVAELLANTKDAIAQCEAKVGKMMAELAKARALVPPEKPVRLLGTGYVRLAGGKVWLLGSREKGFGAFGYSFDSWDQLFRDFNVQITGHGEDEHGPWWSVENFKRGVA